MNITRVEITLLVWPPFDPPFWMSLLPVTRGHELVVHVHTDEGVTGIGHSDAIPGIFAVDGSGQVRAGSAARIVPDAIEPLLRGQDPLQTEALWQRMFQLAHRKNWPTQGWRRQEILSSMAAVDMALWDLKAKVLGLPAFRLLGGADSRVGCYLAGGYYRDGKSVDDLAGECRRYAEQGFRAVKIRVGGLGLAEDVERVAAAREALGPRVKLMLDANEAYGAETGIAAARAFAPMDIFWYEEPSRWYEGMAGAKRVADAIDIPLASGEHAATRWEAAELAEHTGLRYMQFDGMRNGGPTEWLKVAAYCDARGIPMAPHHGAHIHAHLVAAVPNGLLVEVFADPFSYPDGEGIEFVRYDQKRELFSVYPEVVDGDMVLSDRPGWGIELDEEVMARRAVPLA